MKKVKVFICGSKEKKEKLNGVINFAKTHIDFVDDEQEADVIYSLDKKPLQTNKKVVEVNEYLYSDDIYEKILHSSL
jgi:hypothetical protein